MAITVKIKTPRFSTYLVQSPDTHRVCSEEGCESAAAYVQGYYLVGPRRVRVWVCLTHWGKNPLLVLPTPPSILAAEQAEAEWRAAEDYRLKFVEPERGESIKALAPSGHGEPIPGDRVKAWRWGG